jgi:4-amino-4-deoxy-L-arabinose transferase-like glycosyltransferase
MNSSAKPDSRTEASLLVFCFWFALGLTVTLTGLSEKTPYYDEIFETRMAVLPVTSQVLSYFNPEELQRTSPPLYHIILNPILVWFGVTPFTMRSVSWLAGAANIALVYFLLRRLFTRPWPFLGALGFMVSSWHIILSQTARQHSLFFMFVLLSLLALLSAEKSRWRLIPYAMFLAAACHTYYWGSLAVLPSHILATLLMRKMLVLWRQALLAQLVAAITAVPYVFPILRGYRLLDQDKGSGWSALAIPHFSGIVIDFSAAPWSQLEVEHLPWVAILSVTVLVAIVSGTYHWCRDQDAWARWLGLCLLAWFLILFPAYVMGSSTLLGSPLIRRFAILQIPLLVAFLYGVSHISRPVFRYGLYASWLASTTVFGVSFMNSNLYRGSQLVADQVARLAVPVTTFLNFDTSLPAEQGSLAFLLERMNASNGHEFRYFDFRSSDVEPSVVENGISCFAYMREGGYLQARLAAFMEPGSPGRSPDAKLNRSIDEIVSRLTSNGWTTIVTEYYPGRVSFRLACLERVRSPA